MPYYSLEKITECKDLPRLCKDPFETLTVFFLLKMIRNKKYLLSIFLFSASVLVWIPLLLGRYTCILQDSPQLSACLDTDTWNIAENPSLVYLMQFSSPGFNITYYAPKLCAKPWDSKFYFQIHQTGTAAVKDIKLHRFEIVVWFLTLVYNHQPHKTGCQFWEGILSPLTSSEKSTVTVVLWNFH